jgi:hypothetical protein
VTEPDMSRTTTRRAVTVVREVLLTMPRAALKVLAFKWFKAGFALSGQGFNGETVAASHQGLHTLLRAEFNRRWGDEHS